MSNYTVDPQPELREKQELEKLRKMAKVKKKIDKLSAKNRVIRRK